MFDLLGPIQNTLIANAVAPLVLKTGDLSGAVDHLKRSVARAAQEQLPYPKEFIAKHFGKSARWLYIYLEEPKPNSALSQLRELHVIMDALLDLGPAWSTAEEILRRVHSKRASITLAHLETLLEFYESLALVQSSCGEDGRTLYALPDRNQVFKDLGTRERRMERFERTSSAIPTLAASYVLGDKGARFGIAQLKVSESAWLSCIADIDRYIRRRIHEAVEETIENDPEDLTSKAYQVALLAGGGNPPQP